MLLSYARDKPAPSPEQIYEWSEGNIIYACKQYVKDFQYKGKQVNVSQLKNQFVYPGLALALSIGKFKEVNHSIFEIAAKTLTQIISNEDMRNGRCVKDF
jgi:malate dehydrogenase (oxaloacetate-decarboxylating)(NADP+)